MTVPEAEWVLETIATSWPAGDWTDVPLRRVNRDDSRNIDLTDDPRRLTDDLKRSNYVDASYADRAGTPVGTEYDHDLETAIGVRIVGLHVSQYGYVDPDGEWPPAPVDGENWGVPFDPLVRAVRQAILSNRTHPDVEAPDTDYHTVTITNEAPQWSNYADYYAHSFDVVFRGYEELP